MTRLDGRRLMAAALLVVLPVAVLLPLGLALLWIKGWWLWWLGAAALCTAAAYLALRTTRPALRAPAAPADWETIGKPDPEWTPREREAWDRIVLPRAKAASPEILYDGQAALALAQELAEELAATLRPGATGGIWAFTVPEALALTEAVARRLRANPLVRFSRYGTVGQALAADGWSPAIRRVAAIAHVGYDAYRVIRPAINLPGAILAEVRGWLSSLAGKLAHDEIAGVVVRALVLEFGRSAIDLYGGRLAIDAADAARATSTATREEDARPPLPAEPPRILLAGQINAGKSSLVNALIRGEIGATVDVLAQDHGFVPHRLVIDGTEEARLVESPGLRDDDAAQEQLLKYARDSDLIVWCAAADRADRATDRTMLDRLRDAFATDAQHSLPPLLLALTGVDRLRPVTEWEPPYNVADEIGDKAVTMRAAIDAAQEYLGFARERIIPIALPDDKAHFNVDTLWALMLQDLPAAKTRNLHRRHTMARDGRGIIDFLADAADAGWWLGRTALRGIGDAR